MIDLVPGAETNSRSMSKIWGLEIEFATYRSGPNGKLSLLDPSERRGKQAAQRDA
jgi:hypothetical protein